MRFWRALGENLGDFIVSVASKFAIYGQILDFLASHEGLVPSIQNEVYRIVRLDWRRNGQLTHQEVGNTDSERIVLPRSHGHLFIYFSITFKDTSAGSNMNTAVNGLKVRADGLKERASESATYALGLSKRIFYTTVISTISVALIANASAFMYATFYYAFVPSPEHEAFVNPTFEPCGPTDDSMLRCGFLNATGDVGGATGPVLMAGQVILIRTL